MENIWTFTLDKLVNFKGVPIDFKISRFHSIHLGSSSAYFPFFSIFFPKLPQKIDNHKYEDYILPRLMSNTAQNGMLNRWQIFNWIFPILKKFSKITILLASSPYL